MTVAFEAPNVVLHSGDCIEVMRSLPAESVDAIVTDPPYGLEFMGATWDSFGKDTSNGYREKPRITKRVESDEHAVSAFAGAAGGGVNSFQAGRPFQEWCRAWAVEALRVLKPGGHMLAFGGSRTWHRLQAGIEDAGFEIRDSIAWLYGSGFPKSMDVSRAIDALGARSAIVNADESDRWSGWGTALKPAFEPIVVARKPLGTTVAKNVLAHGTGALNIDACRTAFASEADRKESTEKNQHAKFGTKPGQNEVYGDYSMVEVKDYDSSKGRWPTNVLLDGPQAATLDAQAGGASRFFPVFRYEAKAGSDERPKVDGVMHPTVKPLTLMRWLCRLVTPAGGTVLEPFAGSGTTLEAALLEGFAAIGIEKEPAYLPLIEQRITKPLQVAMFGDWGGDAA